MEEIAIVFLPSEKNLDDFTIIGMTYSVVSRTGETGRFVSDNKPRPYGSTYFFCATDKLTKTFPIFWLKHRIERKFEKAIAFSVK